MSNENKTQGKLVFDINSGKFWIKDEVSGLPLTSLEFGDTFEVMYNGEWTPTALQISNNEAGELVFQLKNTDLAGILDDLDVRA